MNKQQITNLLGAGTISALAVALALMFGGRGNSQTTNAAPIVESGITEVVTADDYGSLAEQNAQLQEAVTVLQEREAQYQEQLVLAQETLNEQALAAEATYGEGEYEEEEHEEEEEEHEEEHEEEEEYEEDDD